MKKSEKHRKLAEDFLTSRGYSISDLTPQQQKIVEGYVRAGRGLKYSVTLIVISALLLASVTFYGFRKLYGSISFVNSKDIIFYAVVAESYDRVIEPRQVQQLTHQVTELATVNGVRFATTLFLVFIIVTAVVQNRDKRKMIDAFLPKTNDTDDMENG